MHYLVAIEGIQRRDRGRCLNPYFSYSPAADNMQFSVSFWRCCKFLYGIEHRTTELPLCNTETLKLAHSGDVCLAAFRLQLVGTNGLMQLLRSQCGSMWQTLFACTPSVILTLTIQLFFFFFAGNTTRREHIFWRRVSCTSSWECRKYFIY